MNKKLSIAALALAGVLALTGCSAAPATSAPTQTEAPAPEPLMSDDDVLIAGLRSTGNSYVDAASDYDLIKTAHSVCEALDAGNTVQEVIYYLAANSPTDDLEFSQFEGLLIGAAVGVYCPQYSYQVSQL